mmetsp:Transcript_44481/g.137729  ORF Transcript_44481/g.137729 Transcript_44481/m.137729 type:complete len:230 (-) Transcript_44481:145-834(-)
MGMHRSSSGRGRRAAVLTPAALLASLLGLAWRASSPSAFAAGPQRRQALSGLAPLLLPAVPGAARAGEPAAAGPARVSGTRTGGKFSFALPTSGTKDWVANKQAGKEEALFERKDGAFIAVTPVPEGYVTARFNGEAGPGNGFKLETYTLGKEQDNLEWTKLPTIWRGAQTLGFDSGYSSGDPTSFHQWIRVLHSPQGDVMMTIAVGMDKFNKEKDALKGVLDSFRLEA